ncbi:unnamed protein product [Lepeophtheirus salmonis]|uniref:(salmon louse) hypothetical protein n=1 Tax=Lepeophtheirus salmonis TaxID=72036 RepID=A0A7R8CXJ0_LEPSM|nr:unnamed protein product [Lepeophtheirus salmonis]CAF2960681.1 unnamed protein product [Lepeophtheirus salmonis]
MERLPLMGKMNSNCSLTKPKEFAPAQDEIPLYCTQLSCKDPQVGLWKCLTNGDLTTFSSILAEVAEVCGNNNNNGYSTPSILPSSHWINSKIYENDRNILQLALELEPPEKGIPFVKKLLDAGANADFFNVETDLALIHVAVQSNNLKKVEALLELEWNKGDISVTTQPEGQNALHLAVNNPGILRRLLKEPKARINAKDNCGSRTPLQLALLAKNRESTILLIENGANLEEKVVGDGRKISILDKSEISAGTVRGGVTLLQRAAIEGLNEFVCVLINNGADANMYSKENLYTPTILAASRGHYQVLESLLYKGKAIIATWTPDSQETLLHVILRKSLRTGHASDQSIYEKCLNVLLESEDFCTQLKPVINKKDDLGNTCLHFAAKSWPQKVTLKLLELGANIDNYCTQTKKDPDDYSDSFEVTFRYDFLAPPVTEEQLQNWDREKQTQLELEALPETDSLWYIARSKTHRHLIKHPVLTSFMWLKWQKIRRLFNRNLRFYLLFVVLLTWYIFARFGGKSLNIRGDGEDFCSELRFDESYFGFFYILFALHVLVQIGFVITDWYKDYYNDGFTSCILGSWLEIFMFLVFAIVLYGSLGLLKWMLSSFKRYLLSVENWMEIFLIGILSVILFGNSVVPCKWNRHLAAIALLISWAELITMVGRHPKLARYNIYVTMFYKVLEKIMGIMWIKETTNFFDSPWLTLAKTFTMFVGEIEFSDIPVDRSTDESEYIALPVIAYLFLLAFVFFIVVVLMNLLNGLAITDTGIIQARAEIVSNVTRVESVSYAESVLLGDPFDFLSSSSANGDGPFSWLNRHLPSCALLNALYTKSPTVRSAFQKITGATGILLFFTLLTDKSARFPHVAKGLLGGRVNAEVRDILAKSKDITRKKKLKKKEDREDITIEKSFTVCRISSLIL